jgi:hypothetical protein
VPLQPDSGKPVLLTVFAGEIGFSFLFVVLGIKLRIIPEPHMAHPWISNPSPFAKVG